MIFAICRNPVISNVLIRWALIGSSLVEVSGSIGSVYSLLIPYAFPIIGLLPGIIALFWWWNYDIFNDEFFLAFLMILIAYYLGITGLFVIILYSLIIAAFPQLFIQQQNKRNILP